MLCKSHADCEVLLLDSIAAVLNPNEHYITT